MQSACQTRVEQPNSAEIGGEPDRHEQDEDGGHGSGEGTSEASLGKKRSPGGFDQVENDTDSQTEKGEDGNPTVL